MKRFILSVFVSLIAVALTAQSPQALQGSERAAAIGKILKANSVEKPISFDFKMTRHNSMMAQDLVSTGHAAMVFPDKLLWKVDSPKESRFVMNGNMVTTGIGSQAKTTDISSNRRVQAISRNISSFKTKGLINDTDFKVTVYYGDGGCHVEMVPKRRDLSQIFSMITLIADVKTGVITSVILSEAGGDSSTIKIINPSHKSISDGTFNVK